MSAGRVQIKQVRPGWYVLVYNGDTTIGSVVFEDGSWTGTQTITHPTCKVFPTRERAIEWVLSWVNYRGGVK
jgi:hypothetical protein